MPRRKETNIPRAVEDGARLLSDHIAKLQKQAKKHTLSPAEFYQLDRATERLHQLNQDIAGPIPKRVLEKMTPEDLDTVTTIFARYGLA